MSIWVIGNVVNPVPSTGHVPGFLRGATPVEHPKGTQFNGAGPSTIFRSYGAPIAGSTLRFDMRGEPQLNINTEAEQVELLNS